MADLSDLTDKDLQDIGEMVLAELNISLFNAGPTIHKAYQVYIELVQAGYKEKNKHLACARIKQYFLKRTVRNQRKEFQQYFGIPFSDEMRPLLALSLRTSEIDSEIVRKVTFKTNKILGDLDAFKKFKIDEIILNIAISELYRPKYHENEWKITIPALFGKIKKILIAQGEGHSIDSLEEVFYNIDPNPKKKKPHGLKLVKEQPDQKITEDGTKEGPPKRNMEHQQVSFLGPTGPVSEFEETSLARANTIKESELIFVKGILELINSDEIPEVLDADLYQNDKRHPLVTNFLNLVKRYDALMGDRERSLKEVLGELRMVVRGIRETGSEIVGEYEALVGEKVQALEFELKRAG